MKRPTQVDVAREAGVSRATVSYVLNGVVDGKVPISEETRQRVLEAIEDLGYVPDARARALRSGDTKTIGLVILDIRNPHFWETAEGVEQEARAAGYQVLLSNIALKGEYASEIFKDLSQRRIDGLILPSSYMAASAESQDSLQRFSKRQMPIVQIGDHLNGYSTTDIVASNYHEATKEVIGYLLGLNHRRIALLFGVENAEHAMDRLQPYREALLAAGQPLDDRLIARCGPTIEEGYQATLQLLTLPERPTAILAINDLLAMGALRAISDAGLRVPEDISLVGYDDILMARFLVPRLTTVTKDIHVLGRAAVRLLLARIQEPERPRQTERYPARLIVRESTGPAPQ